MLEITSLNIFGRMSQHGSLGKIFDLEDMNLKYIKQVANYDKDDLKRERSKILTLKIPYVCYFIRQYMRKLPNIDACLTVSDNIVLYNLRHLMEGFMAIFELQFNEKIKNYENLIKKREKRLKDAERELKREERSIAITLDVNELATCLETDERFADVRRSIRARFSHIRPTAFSFMPEEQQRTLLGDEGAPRHSFQMNLSIGPDAPQVPLMPIQEEPTISSVDRSSMPRISIDNYINEIIESPSRGLRAPGETARGKSAKQNFFRTSPLASSETVYKKFQNRISKQTKAGYLLTDDEVIFSGLPEEAYALEKSSRIAEQMEPLAAPPQEQIPEKEVVGEAHLPTATSGSHISDIQRDEEDFRMEVDEGIPLESIIALQRERHISLIPRVRDGEVMEDGQSISRMQSMDSAIIRQETLTDVLETTVDASVATAISEGFGDDLMIKLNFLWIVNEAKFTDLCPKHVTSRRIAAKTFLTLLYLWRANKIELEQQGIDPESIIIREGRHTAEGAEHVE
ncbi:hypothetical protein AAG570_010755 [Ranatra chinensis]|uniref:Rad21/Rec8-like protein N-terminal domain-containing protein n=1 Tax=Ranatra chinensis TaxID=642074 RepID=A0ABD0Z9J4_9HEMI